MSKYTYRSIFDQTTDIGRVIARVQKEVYDKGSDVIETGDMLLGIVAEPESVGSLFLRAQGITEAMVRRGIEAFDRDNSRTKKSQDGPEVPVPANASKSGFGRVSAFLAEKMEDAIKKPVFVALGNQIDKLLIPVGSVTCSPP